MKGSWKENKNISVKSDGCGCSAASNLKRFFWLVRVWWWSNRFQCNLQQLGCRVWWWSSRCPCNLRWSPWKHVQNLVTSAASFCKLHWNLLLHHHTLTNPKIRFKLLAALQPHNLSRELLFGRRSNKNPRLYANLLSSRSACIRRIFRSLSVSIGLLLD